MKSCYICKLQRSKKSHERRWSRTYHQLHIHAALPHGTLLKRLEWCDGTIRTSSTTKLVKRGDDVELWYKRQPCHFRKEHAWQFPWQHAATLTRESVRVDAHALQDALPNYGIRQRVNDTLVHRAPHAYFEQRNNVVLVSYATPDVVVAEALAPQDWRSWRTKLYMRRHAITTRYVTFTKDDVDGVVRWPKYARFPGELK